MLYLLIYSEADQELGFHESEFENKLIYSFKLFDFKKQKMYCGDSNLKLSGKYIYPSIDSLSKTIPLDYNSQDLIPISYRQFQAFKKMSFKNLSTQSKTDFLMENGLEEWVF